MSFFVKISCTVSSIWTDIFLFYDARQTCLFYHPLQLKPKTFNFVFMLSVPLRFNLILTFRKNYYELAKFVILTFRLWSCNFYLQAFFFFKKMKASIWHFYLTDIQFIASEYVNVLYKFELQLLYTYVSVVFNLY